MQEFLKVLFQLLKMMFQISLKSHIKFFSQFPECVSYNALIFYSFQAKSTLFFCIFLKRPFCLKLCSNFKKLRSIFGGYLTTSVILFSFQSVNSSSLCLRSKLAAFHCNSVQSVDSIIGKDGPNNATHACDVFFCRFSKCSSVKLITQFYLFRADTNVYYMHVDLGMESVSKFFFVL